jgi:DNA polymerase-3 subunit alpha
VIERALDLIEANAGERPDIDNIPLDDPATFELLRKGESIGIFQLEGSAMRALMRALAPTSFDDVAALVALYRPGPMAANMHYDYADRKNGRKPITYLHGDLEPLLADTQGLMVYQESMMRVAQKFAGYSLEEADNLRKAAGKKVREIMAKEREKFVAGCEQTGYGREIGTQLFDVIEPFADYAFNKSHSYGYGFVSYQTAWLKANHPVEYLAALLTSVKDDKDKTAVYLAECRNIGIEVLVPDINVSSSDFTAVRGAGSAGKGAIPFGMSAVRNVGSGLVERIVIERASNGPFNDFYDFCERVDPIVLNKRTVESLIKAGAFDSLGHPRQGLCLVFEQIVDRILARRREREQGVMSLFGDMGGAEAGPDVFDDARLPIPENDFEKMQRLAFEKEMLGLYVSDHPLMGAEAALRRHAEVTVRQMREQNEGELKWVGGVITGLVRKYTKRGDLMATFTLEDLEAALDVWVFPRTMQEVGHLLADDAVVCVRGRLDLRDDEAKLICMELRRPELVLDGAEPLHLDLPIHALSDDRVDRLKRLLVDHPGESPVFLHVGSKTIRLADGFNVEARNGLLAELRVLLGPSCLWQGALD